MGVERDRCLHGPTVGWCRPLAHLSGAAVLHPAGRSASVAGSPRVRARVNTCPTVTATRDPVTIPRLRSGFRGREVIWRCAEGHEWAAVVYARTLSRSGCPTCYRLETSERIKVGKKRARRIRDEQAAVEVAAPMLDKATDDNL